MKTESTEFLVQRLITAMSAFIAVAAVGLLSTGSTAQAAQLQSSDRSGFLLQDNAMSGQPGSPVGRKQKIVVCYKGKEVKRIDLNKFLKYLEKEPGKYTAGPCPTWALVCENNHDVKWVKTSELAKWLEGHKNRKQGNCTGVKPDDERVICWKDWTILTKVKYLIKYPGYTVGVCHESSSATR